MDPFSGFNNLPLVVTLLPKVANQLVRKGAFDVQAQAQANAPVQTGYLKNSIYTLTDHGESTYDVAKTAAEATEDAEGRAFLDQVEKPIAPVGGARAVVAVGANYGVFVEEGTSHATAQPYLQPAVDQVKPAYEAAASKVEERLRAFGL